ncbi:zinc ribbon-containing protein [Candidatus Parcubacteria bacterium]|nr:zinc ribbon-containing protein [Candidatus Parcubacteria bacterium]
MSAQAGENAQKTGTFHCDNCGERVRVEEGRSIPRCPNCGNDTYDSRTQEPGTKG